MATQKEYEKLSDSDKKKKIGWTINGVQWWVGFTW